MKDISLIKAKGTDNGKRVVAWVCTMQKILVKEVVL